MDNNPPKTGGLPSATTINAKRTNPLDDRAAESEVDRVQINGQMLSPPYGLAWAGVKRDMFDGLDAPVPAGAW